VGMLSKFESNRVSAPLTPPLSDEDSDNDWSNTLKGGGIYHASIPPSCGGFEGSLYRPRNLPKKQLAIKARIASMR